MPGRPERRSNTEILEIVANAEGQAISTPEVKERLSYSQSGIWRRLKELADDDLLVERKTGEGNATLWLLTDDGREHLESEPDASELEGDDGNG